MNVRIITGNAVSLIACTVMVISGYAKSRKNTLALQTVQIALNALSCGILGAYSGMIINLLSIPRNILAQKNRLYFRYKIILLVLIVGLSCFATIQKSRMQGHIEWIGFVPLISTVTYMFLMDRLDGVKFKYLVMFTMSVWIVHDFAVENYVAVVFNVLNIITSLLAVRNINKSSRSK